MKEIENRKRKRGKEEKNIEKGREATIRPRLEISPRPTRTPYRTGTPFPSPLADSGPHLSGVFNLQP
jgi:hypothetical protein